MGCRVAQVSTVFLIGGARHEIKNPWRQKVNAMGMNPIVIASRLWFRYRFILSRLAEQSLLFCLLLFCPVSSTSHLHLFHETTSQIVLLPGLDMPSLRSRISVRDKFGDFANGDRLSLCSVSYILHHHPVLLLPGD